MGDADRVWRVSRAYRSLVDLGPGASSAVLPDIHKSSVEELAGERRVHHCGLFSCTCDAFHRKSAALDFVTTLADRWRLTAFHFDCGLHGLPFRTGEGARSLAEPTVAAASVRAGIAARFRRALANCGVD